MPIVRERDPSARDGRRRLLDGAVALLAEKGFNATELRDVATRGQAPRGSIYHHFPGGKVQLAAEAAEYSSKQTEELIERSLAVNGVLATIRLLAGRFREAAGGDASRLGCPVAAVAVTDDPRLRSAAAEAFSRWEAVIARALECDGIPPASSRAVAALALSTIEGALVRARAQNDLVALDDALNGLEVLLRPLVENGVGSQGA
jgi:TetR/AcrR family transcriptional repressor of lmrAB and yxaGH operons